MAGKAIEEAWRRRLVPFQSEHFLQLILLVEVGIHNYLR
jgi:hypothetical protein